MIRKLFEKENAVELPRVALGLGWAALDMVIMPGLKKLGSLGAKPEPNAPPARVTYYPERPLGPKNQ